jgi:hypothetical protein
MLKILHYITMKKIVYIQFLFFTILLLNIQSYATAQSIIINEFMASNRTVLADEDGDYSDWIELYNRTSQDINLQGWRLTDNMHSPSKWILPDVTLKANRYLVIFASGKDRRDPQGELHTNFSLDRSGEYLGLYDNLSMLQWEFSPAYPEQRQDISYGFYLGTATYFTDPTPGISNEESESILLHAPQFSANHGFYDSPFELTIEGDTSLGDIYYTTNGSTPSHGNGIRYTTPITIESTSVVRAAILGSEKITSVVNTRTYLFLNDIIHQSNDQPGYPDQWGAYTAINGTATAHYAMNQELINDPAFANTLKEGLKDLPIISLVTDIGYLFSHDENPETGGIYIHTGAPIGRTTYGIGRGWERPVSFEYFNADGSISLQVNCGVLTQGGHGRRPEKSPKRSFRLMFRSRYGPSRLEFPLFGPDATDTFKALNIRGGFGNSWIHQDANQRRIAVYQRDTWGKDTQGDLGHPKANAIYAHLFINGMYWGLYNPSERLDRRYAASYLGGEEDDFDVINNYTEIQDGNLEAWDRMISMANRGLASDSAYQRIQGNNPDGNRNPELENLVDVVNLTDYMLINFYGGNTDWDHHNWAAIRNRVTNDRGFIFMCWDMERILESRSINRLNVFNANCPSNIFTRLMDNDNFRQLFVERANRHLFNNGALTPEKAIERWRARTVQIEKAIYGEVARWGNYRRDVHNWNSGPYEQYHIESHWLPRQDYITNTYFPDRTDIFIQQLRSAGFLPDLMPPLLLVNGSPIDQKLVSKGDILEMATHQGAIYYTLDGTSPENWTEPGSDVRLYNGEIEITKSIHVIARAFHNGKWSSVTDQKLVIPADYKDLKITEIHYHPLNSDQRESKDYQFIELKNTGDATIYIGGAQFIGGISYQFPANMSIPPQQFVVLASNSAAFEDRYGFQPNGEFSGYLSDSGDMINLASPFGDLIFSVTYNNSNGWPTAPAGEGYSLVPNEINPTGGQNNSWEWRASHHIGGSPGEDDNLVSNRETIHKNQNFLNQNFPNPFSNSTSIQYSIAAEGAVELSVYNLMGHKITTLVSSVQPEGTYTIQWSTNNAGGNSLASGIYIYRLSVESEVGSEIITKKMVLTD